MGRIVRHLGLYLILIVLVVSLANTFLTPAQPPQQFIELSYSEFVSRLEAGEVRTLSIKNNTLPGESSSATLRGDLASGVKYLTYSLEVGNLATEAAKKSLW